MFHLFMRALEGIYKMYERSTSGVRASNPEMRISMDIRVRSSTKGAPHRIFHLIAQTFVSQEDAKLWPRYLSPAFPLASLPLVLILWHVCAPGE